MPMHSGDEFSRRGTTENEPFEGRWPPRLPQTNNVTPRYNKRAVTDWDQASTDSTNMDMLEQGTIQPEDI